MSLAIITGASRGIGRAIALSLAQSGWNLGLIATNMALLQEAAGEIREGAGSVKLALEQVDVRDYSSVAGATERIVAALGAPSLLINNAGRIDAEVPIWEADPEQLESVVSTNVLGTLFMERAVLPHMIENGGRVVNLVSGAGARSWGLAPAYTSSKAAQLRNVGDLAEVGAGLNIRAFGVAPGVVATDMTAGMDAHADRVDYTPVSATLDLVDAIARGELDAWSGTYLRADIDTPESLTQAGVVREGKARQFGVFPYGEGDLLA